MARCDIRRNPPERASVRQTVTTSLGRAVVLAAALLLGACGDDSDVPDGYRQSADGPAKADVNDQPPYGPGAEAGRSYDYVLYTHCGIEWSRIDGVWWQSTPLDDGNANPPAGWGNPYDEGEIEIVGDTTAVYRGGPGAEIEFERTDIVEAPFSCE